MARLGDIATVITKGTTPTSIGFNFQNDGINFVKIESVDENGSFICEKFDHISDECHEKLKRSQLQENDILFSIAGAIGRTAIVTKDILPANTNQALAIIRIPQGVINYSFLLYILQSSVVLDQAEKKKQGVAQLNLSLKDIGDFIIPDIPLEEQQCIVDILDKVSNLISLRKQQLAKLDELVKSRFIEMFGTIHNNKFGYEVKTLQDVCEQIKDGTHQTPTYTDDHVNGYKFLSSKDVTTGKIDWTHLKYIPEELHNELYARIAPKKGDILLVKNGTTGIAAIVDRDEVFDIYVSLALLRPIEIKAGYLWAAINSVETKQQFDSSLKGIGVPNLHLGEIKKVRIIVPPIEEQNAFVTFVEQTDKSKLAIQKSLEKLETLKKALMQKYFG